MSWCYKLLFPLFLPSMISIEVSSFSSKSFPPNHSTLFHSICYKLTHIRYPSNSFFVACPVPGTSSSTAMSLQLMSTPSFHLPPLIFTMRIPINCIGYLTFGIPVISYVYRWRELGDKRRALTISEARTATERRVFREILERIPSANCTDASEIEARGVSAETRTGARTLLAALRRPVTSEATPVTT